MYYKGSELIHKYYFNSWDIKNKIKILLVSRRKCPIFKTACHYCAKYSHSLQGRINMACLIFKKFMF